MQSKLNCAMPNVVAEVVVQVSESSNIFGMAQLRLDCRYSMRRTQVHHLAAGRVNAMVNKRCSAWHSYAWTC